MTGKGGKRHLAHPASQTLFLVLAFLLVIPVNPVHGEIYRWKDAQGKVHFGDRPPPEATTSKVEVEINTYESVEVLYGSDSPNTPAAQKRDAKSVVMYSAQWCGVCDRAKAYFKKNKIPFRELDIDKSEKARKGFEKLQGRGVPIILVGNKRMNGFSPGRFEKLYADAR